MKRKILATMRADRLAIKLGQVTGSSHVTVTISARRWWHNLGLQTLYMREWSGCLK